MGGKMRRKWKCGRWEGATDGGQHANSQLSLAEPSQTGMRAFPQVGAAWTLGGSRPAGGPAPGKVAGTRGHGGFGPATGQLPRSKPRLACLLLVFHSHHTHTVCPSSWYCLYLSCVSI